ncbi:MAG: CvpA family protein [Patescibacteria group bacterium]|jgi:membrane protein required for colicin V production
MSVYDIVIVGIIGGFGLFGIWFGIISTLGSLLGTAAGVYLAGRFYEIPAEYLIKFTHWSGNFPKVAMFIICFLIINRLVGLLFHILDKSLFVFTSLPFISGLNKILGLIFGLFEGIIFIGIVFYIVDRYGPWSGFLGQLSRSNLVTICEGIASFLWPLLPDAMKFI